MDKVRMIKTYKLSKMYGKRVGCSEICLAVDRGQIFGFLGPNGAGKSTLVKILVGLLFPTSGTGEILGRPLGDLNSRRKIGYLPENFRYQPWLSGEELLKFHASLYKMDKSEVRNRIAEVLQQVGLSSKEKQRVGSYSKGMQQRIGLACALLPDPDLIFLDEPTSALDPLGRRQVREIILDLKSKGKTVFLNSHLLSEVEMICDQVAFINQGKIVVRGTMEELLVKAIVVEMYVEGITEQMLFELTAISKSLAEEDKLLKITFEDREMIPAAVEIILKNAGRLYSLELKHYSLEDMFVSLIQGGDEPVCLPLSK